MSLKKFKTRCSVLSLLNYQAKFFEKEIFLAPEGALNDCFVTNNFLASSIRNRLFDNQLVAVGHYEQFSKNSFQAVKILTADKEFNIYKKRLCPVFEEMFFSQGLDEPKIFHWQGCGIQPLICSDFFLNSFFEDFSESELCLLFVKELAFPLIFQEQLFSYVNFWSWFHKKNLIVICYSGLRSFLFSGNLGSEC